MPKEINDNTTTTTTTTTAYDLFPPLSPDANNHANSEESELRKANEDSNYIPSILSNEFIDEIIHSQKSKRKRADNEKEALSLFINHSKLMHQLKELDTNLDDILTIQNKSANVLQLKKLAQGDILFRINDIGDNCYFVIKGKFEALKQKELLIAMTIDNYIAYLMHLKYLHEDSFLATVLELNFSKLHMKIEELNKIAFYYIKHKIIQSNIKNELDLHLLKEIISYYHKGFSDFTLNQSEIEDYYKTNLLEKNGNSLWTKFIYEAFKHTPDDKLFYERTPYLHNIDLLTNNTFTILIYEKFLSFRRGDLFGYFSLELKEKRNATMRAEQDSVVGYLKKDDYFTLISPQQKKRKEKYLSFLLQSFFFSSISQIAFIKNFFHFFVLNEASSCNIMHKQGSRVTSLVFIAKGEIKVTAALSILDIHNITKRIIDRLVQLKPNGVTELQLNEMRSKYLVDNEIIKMGSRKGKQNSYTIEMNKKRVLKLYSLGNNDIVGIEEAFLGLDYLSSFESGHKVVRYYSIDIGKIKQIFAKERNCIKPYTETALNKIHNYLLRVNEIKRSLIEYFQYKNKNNESILENIYYRRFNNGNNAYNSIRKNCFGGLVINRSMVEDIKCKPKKLFATSINASILEEKSMCKVFKSSSMSNRLSKKIDCSSLVKIPSTNRDSSKDYLNESNNNNNTVNNNPIDSNSDYNTNLLREENPLAINIQPTMKRMRSQKMKLPFKSTHENTSISKEVNSKNTCFSLDSFKYTRKPKILKSINSFYFKWNDKSIITKECSSNNQEDMKISLINLMGLECPEESIEEKDELSYIKSIKPPKKNQCLISRLDNHKIRSNSLYKLNQEELITSIEKVLEANLENNGENVIANRIKRYYFNKKSVGYAYLRNSSFFNKSRKASSLNKSSK